MCWLLYKAKFYIYIYFIFFIFYFFISYDLTIWCCLHSATYLFTMLILWSNVWLGTCAQPVTYTLIILCIFLHIIFHYIIQCLMLLFIMFSSCRIILQLMAHIFLWIFWGYTNICLKYQCINSHVLLFHPSFSLWSVFSILFIFWSSKFSKGDTNLAVWIPVYQFTITIVLCRVQLYRIHLATLVW